ncbi:bifunctional DNA-formamidopyrimidine glycosylase/DNA-(apurinic or apyrimidinic site) lyase [Candidatus Saccharibacteria bacterium]|nr:bifunctional DNA-formamidopyrimidine glycosylase/DNA-(apurinic or apyrimidinic site) lyase [Candidatus Saccharibacteria bacterium]
MPELPEVETVRRGLNELIIGKTVQSVHIFDSPKSFPNDDATTQQFLYGAIITDVRRRAKVLLIDLSTEYTLVIHLKMTGQLVYVKEAKGTLRFGAGHPNDSLIGELPDRSTRVAIEFTDGSHLYFNDQRKFGWIKLLPTFEVPNMSFMQKVGPEPLEPEFTDELFFARLQRRKNATIKAAILDQTVLAGVGNIYADESLWGARIHPSTKVATLPRSKIKDLRSEIVFVMNLSIEKGGSTDRNYVNAEGKRGSYIDFARVFRKEGLPCPRHPDVIVEKIKVAGRGTHVCSVCQPMPQ